MTLAALSTGILLLASGDRVARRPTTVVIRPEATSITLYTVLPASVTFAATNPTTTPSVSGSSAVTLAFSLNGGSSARTWNIQLKSATATFAGCTTVPVNAITATCSAVTGGTGGTCAGAFPLSTTNTLLSSGTEANGTASYTVTVTFSLADDWKYLPVTCTPQTFSYLLTAN